MTPWFSEDCDIVGHQPGDRHWHIGGSDSEWTGDAWTVVCPVDDLPMTARDGQGWLVCGVCGMKSTQVPARTAPPAEVTR